MKDVAIITVVYKNYTVLKDYLESIRKQKNRGFKLFVVDLTDSPEEIKLPEGAILIHSVNKGYAYGVNEGLMEAVNNGYERFCIMNSDTYFEADFVASIMNFIDKHPSSIGGGKIYYAPGYEYHVDRYSKSDLGKVIWFVGGKIDWNNVYTSHLGVDEVDSGQFDEEKKVDFLTGCVMFFDKAALDKVGMWDESYFLYYEDAEWSVRATKAGVDLLYTPKVVIWHKNAQSTDGAGSSIHTKYQEKNRVKFGLRYAPIRTKIHLLKNSFWHN